MNKDFFNNQMSDFSSPEILRIPLEKLILKIKVWGMFEPETILGRAIEPPKINHIETAIMNLQNFGALTMPEKAGVTGNLTELGKVYSELPIDIKYSKLIMLAYCFDMIEPAIVISAVLCQEKSMFKNKKNAIEVKYIINLAI